MTTKARQAQDRYQTLRHRYGLDEAEERYQRITAQLEEIQKREERRGAGQRRKRAIETGAWRSGERFELRADS